MIATWGFDRTHLNGKEALSIDIPSLRCGPKNTFERRTSMDFSAKLGELKNHVSEVQTSVEAAADETHDQVKRRIDSAQSDMDKAVSQAKQDAAQASARAESGWAQVKADAAAKVANAKAKADRRADEFDARVAATQADAARADAFAAIDFADWAVESARLTILDAIDARLYAEERAATVRA
jgi:hypothetical protein